MLLLLLDVVLLLLFIRLATGEKSVVDPRTRFRLLVAAGREGPSLDLVALPFSAWCLEAAGPACRSGVGSTAGVICNVRFPLRLEKVRLWLSSHSFFGSRFNNLAVRMRHSWSVRAAVSPLCAESLAWRKRP